MKPANRSEKRRGAATRDQIGEQVTGVEAIEVKATIPDHQIDSALTRYNLTVNNDEERYIYFFDTLDLALFKAGIIARARRIVGDDHDSTVKLRPVVPRRSRRSGRSSMDSSWRPTPARRVWSSPRPSPCRWRRG
jgi:hypothetical protein